MYLAPLTLAYTARNLTAWATFLPPVARPHHSESLVDHAVDPRFQEATLPDVDTVLLGDKRPIPDQDWVSQDDDFILMKAHGGVHYGAGNVCGSAVLELLQPSPGVESY